MLLQVSIGQMFVVGYGGKVEVPTVHLVVEEINVGGSLVGKPPSPKTGRIRFAGFAQLPPSHCQAGQFAVAGYYRADAICLRNQRSMLDDGDDQVAGDGIAGCLQSECGHLGRRTRRCRAAGLSARPAQLPGRTRLCRPMIGRVKHG